MNPIATSHLDTHGEHVHRHGEHILTTANELALTVHSVRTKTQAAATVSLCAMTPHGIHLTLPLDPDAADALALLLQAGARTAREVDLLA